MRVLFKTRVPIGLFRTLLLLILGLVSTIYYFQKDLARTEGIQTSALVSMPSLSLRRKVQDPPVVVKEIVIERNETFSELMKKNGLDAAVAQQIFESTKDVYNLSRISAGKSMVLQFTPDSDLTRLEYTIDPLQTLVIRKQEDEILAEMQKRIPVTDVHELGGYIEGSLYATIDRLGEGDELVIKFAELFEWDVDFFKDLQPGDSFRIVYEKQSVEGSPLGYGRILAAELVNKGNTYTALGYQHGSNWEYFSPDGKAMKKAFLASPLKFSRISSGFTARRYHPVLKTYRPHYGVDYAAPAGTPVRAIGKGRVIFAGRSGGAGNMVKIQHDKEITTAYCHLSKFAVQKGSSVSQGQVIGYVGSTGLATGPHLDFRFMKNGKYVNFLSIKSPQATPLSASEVEMFKAATAGIFERLQAVNRVQTAQQIAYVSAGPMQFTE